MKSANWKAAGLAAVVSLLASNACRAADILFSEAASTCVRNHADVEKVLSAAEATGWHGWPFPEETGPRVNQHLRWKEVNRTRLQLKVETSEQSGTAIRRCSVAGADLSWSDTLEAAKNYFGASPSQELPQAVQWVYVEQDGQRVYFRGDQLKHAEELAGHETLHVLLIGHDPADASTLALVYAEGTRPGTP